MQESFVLFTESWSGIQLLSREQKGDLLQALMAEHGVCAMPEMDHVTTVVFQMMLPRMRANRKKYEEEIERRKAAGKKGGESRASNAKQSQAKSSSAKECLGVLSNAKQSQAVLSSGKQDEMSASSAKECQAIQADTDSDSDSVIDPDTDTDTDPVTEIDPDYHDMGEIDLSSSLPAGQARPVKNAILRQEDFEQWYLAYPRHEGKQSAIKAWNKAIKEKALPSVHSLLASLEWQKDLTQWQDKQFIPLPASYLNGRRWQDEKPAPRPAPMSEGQRIYETYKRWEDEFNQREAANSQAALGGSNG